MTDGDDQPKWDAEQVQSLLMNPFHTMGADATIDDAMWVTAQKRLVEELGAEEYFSTFLALLKECMASAYDA